MSDKTINIGVRADERAFQRANEMVEGLTRSLLRLAAAGNTAGKSINAATPGGTAAKARRGKGGIVTDVLGVQDPTALRSLVTGTQSAFRSVEGDIKRFTDNASANIKRLEDRVASLGAKMANVGSGGGGGGGGGSYSSAVSPLDNRHFTFGSGASDIQLLKNERMAKGKGGGGGGFFGGVSEMAGFAANSAGMGTPFAGLQKMGAGAGIAGVGIGAAMVGNYLTRAGTDSRIANLNYTINEPLNVLNRRASTVQPFAAQYHAGRSGDITSQVAFDRAMKNPVTSHLFGGLMSGARKEELARLGIDIGSTTFGELQKNASSTVGDWMRKIQYDKGIDKVTQKKALDIMERSALMGITGQDREKFDQIVASERAVMDPRVADMMNYVPHAAMSSLQTRRLGGLGPPKGREAMEWMRDREAHLTKRGWSNSEDAGGLHQLLTGAGAAYRKFGGIHLQSLQYGGMHGVEGLLKGMGQLGGSVGAGIGGVNGLVNGSVGRGGLDVNVGSGLFHQLVGRGLGMGNEFGAGNTFSTYGGMAAGAVYAGGVDAAGQARRAAMLGPGLDQLNSINNGSASPLNSFMSSYNWNSATGGYKGLYSERLKKTNVEVLQGIAGGGEVPGGLLSLVPGGGSRDERAARVREHVKRGLPGTEQNMFLEAGGFNVDDTSYTGDFLKKWRGSGKGIHDFLGDMSGDERMRAMEALGSATLGGGPESVFAADVLGFKKPKGRGVGAAGPSGLEGQELDRQSQQLHLDASVLRQFAQEIATALQKSTGRGEAGRSVVNGVRGEGSGDFFKMEKAANIFGDKVDEFSRAVDNFSGTHRGR